MLSGDFGGSAGTPRNQGWPKNAPKNLIRHHLGVPGRERGGPKLFKGPHGQGHKKKVCFVIEFGSENEDSRGAKMLILYWYFQ